MLETVSIVCIVGICIFGFKSIRDFFLNRKLSNNIETLKNENENFKENVDNLTQENKELNSIKCELSNELETFKKDLEDLKGICNLVGEYNEESFEKMKQLYNKHKHILELEIKSNALQILLDLDDNSNFKLNKEEKKKAKKKLNLLFEESDISKIPDEAYDDFKVLQSYIEKIILETN